MATAGMHARLGWQLVWSHECLIAFAWEGARDERLIVAVNYSPNQSQGHARLPWTDLGGRSLRLADLLSPAAYDWRGDDLLSRGLYLDMAPWQAAVYALS